MSEQGLAKKFVEELGIETPVICGPMYPGSNPELVAAVSEAGGLGIMQPISMTYLYGHDFLEGIRLMRSITQKPIGMNFTLLGGNKRYEKRLSHWMDVSIEEKIPVFLTSLGDPAWVVKKAHKHGIKVFHDVTTLKFAEKAVKAGVDGLVCVNHRAGGQTGAESAEKLAKDLQGLGVPLICAGGVGNGDDFVNALNLGYSAVQVGTRFLATKECKVQDDYKQAIVNSQESDIVWTNKLAGTISSVIGTPDITKGGLMVNPFVGYFLKNSRTKKLARSLLLLNSLRKHKNVVHKKGYGQIWQAGKGVGQINTVLSAAEVLDDFHKAYNNWLVKS